MAPLTIVTFLWTPPPGYRSKFEGKHVDILRRMVRRHYPDPHRFICVTDNPRGITEPDVEIYRLWNTFSNIRNPSGTKNPSCYRRLRIFARNAGEWLGPRAVMIDLDCVITGDMRPLWNRPEDFVIWRSSTKGNPYCGSMVLFRTGSRPQLWERFHPLHTPRATLAAGLQGSDQAWIALCLGRNEAVWTIADGVYSYRIQIRPNADRLPANARVVMFHGQPDPWSPACQRIPWVRENYA